MDNMIKIAVYFTYYSEKITDQMWSLFDIFYQAFMTYAADYMPDFLNYYDNVITKDTTAFFARNKLEMVFNMYSKVSTTSSNIWQLHLHDLTLNFLVVGFRAKDSRRRCCFCMPIGRNRHVKRKVSPLTSFEVIRFDLY